MDRTNELPLRNQFEPPNFREDIVGRVQAYTTGYERDIDVFPHLATGIGALLTVYTTPQSLRTQYGSHPVGGLVFLQIWPFGSRR